MAKAFSIASWNVEHFKDDPTRIGRVVEFLKEQAPDVFALYEVEGKEVFAELTHRMPGYTFTITEGVNTQEILLGVKPSITGFLTQRTEFQSGSTYMRPGALLSVRVAGVNYAMLFLHTASGADPRGLGLRDDMLTRACTFRRDLDRAPGSNGQANYLFLGDLNTMGMEYKFARAHDITVEAELEKLSAQAKACGMRMLTKDAPATWWNGSTSAGGLKPSNLDHVVAAEHLRFKSFGGSEVNVRGWPQKATDAAKRAWIRDYSDHGLLYLEVQRV